VRQGSGAAAADRAAGRRPAGRASPPAILAAAVILTVRTHRQPHIRQLADVSAADAPAR
jgi:hypothetical protein